MWRSVEKARVSQLRSDYVSTPGRDVASAFAFPAPGSLAAMNTDVACGETVETFLSYFLFEKAFPCTLSGMDGVTASTFSPPIPGFDELPLMLQVFLSPEPFSLFVE